MNKKAKTIYGIHPLLEDRWSPRSFSDKKVEKEKLQKIFEAAQWSPSSSNEQPWRFIIGEKLSETYQKIFDCLADGNKGWAKLAPVLMVSIARKYYIRNNREYYHHLYDTGQAVAHLTFQAGYEGLHVHQMGGYNPEMIRTSFNIPEEYAIATVIAIGYLGQPEFLDIDQQERELSERKRRDLNETIFTVDFGNPWK
jgi:nitroreductase